MLIPDYVRLMAYRKLSASLSCPFFISERITSTSGCSKVQLLIAFRWITLLWPSNGFGVEKMVSILDPLLSKVVRTPTRPAQF